MSAIDNMTDDELATLRRENTALWRALHLACGTLQIYGCITTNGMSLPDTIYNRALSELSKEEEDGAKAKS